MARVRRIMLYLLILPVLLFCCGFLLPPQYDATFMGELKPKTERLDQTQGRRIILVGGSALAFGVDTEAMQKSLQSFQVVNFGLYAALGTTVMLDLSLPALQEGDIVILIPEQQSQALSGFFSAEILWQGIDGAYDLLFRLPPEKQKAMLAAFPNFAGTKLRYFLTGKPMPEGVYARSSFNEYGDVDTALCDRNRMPGGVDEGTPISFRKEMLSEEFAEAVRTYVKKAEKKGAAVWFAACPMNRLAVENEEEMDNFYSLLTERMDISIAGNPHESILPAGWFYDTNFHLNHAGREVYTRILLEAILAIQGDRRAHAMEEPPMPLPAETEESAGNDADAACFLYEVRNGRVYLNGLTEAGRQQKALTVPTHVAGLPAVGIMKDTFKDSVSLEECTIQSNIRFIAEGAFAGCRNLAVIHLNLQRPSDCSVSPSLLIETEAVLEVPSGRKKDYAADYFWSPLAERIRETE